MENQFLLKAGSVYSGETLNITTSDEDGAPVLVGSYGVGNQPLLESGAKTSVSLSNSHNVVVSDISIEGSGETLVLVSGGSNNTVEKCTITGGSVFPIHISNSPGFKFLNNTYTNGSTRLEGDVLAASWEPRFTAIPFRAPITAAEGMVNPSNSRE